MRFTISGRSYDLTRDKVEAAMRGASPDATDGRHKYVAEVGGVWYPIKQVIGQATGLKRIEFTAQPAYQILSRLGFQIRDVRRVADEPLKGKGHDGASTRTSRKFLVTLERDEDGFFLASCPSLVGCHSQGRTRQAALLNISEAIRAYLESLELRGEEPAMVETIEIEVAA